MKHTMTDSHAHNSTPVMAIGAGASTPTPLGLNQLLTGLFSVLTRSGSYPIRECRFYRTLQNQMPSGYWVTRRTHGVSKWAGSD